MKIESAQFIKGVLGTDSIFEDGIPQVAFINRSNVNLSEKKIKKEKQRQDEEKIELKKRWRPIEVYPI